MTHLTSTHLALFFTRRVGLHHWDLVGSLERESEIYRRLAARLGRVTFVSYGGRRDEALAREIEPIRLCATPPRLPVVASIAFLAARCRSALENASVFKTNQIAGAEVALWAKKRFGKKLIVRCGYLLSQFVEREGAHTGRTRRARELERRAFSQADAGVMTSERDRQWVIENHGIAPDKLCVIPNYVVTDVFRPMPQVARQYDLVCVAKASPQKNLGALMAALRLVRESEGPVSLLLIGSAAAEPDLRQYAERHGLPVTYRQRVKNPDLPAYLNRAKVYIMPSLYEGHPKALLEAMSCGMPCIGTDVVGVRDDIVHLDTGYLCKTEPNSLADAIRAMLGNVQMRRELGRNAREYVLGRYSIESVLSLELDLIAKVHL